MASCRVGRVASKKRPPRCYQHRDGLTRSILHSQESTMADISPIAPWRVVEGVFASFCQYFTCSSLFDAARSRRGSRMGGTS